MTREVTFEWKCPKCGSNANTHDLTKVKKCARPTGFDDCMGFLCECEGEDVLDEEHGTALRDPCREAYCYHCEWSGVFPSPPKGLLPWEKKALEAGWLPPASRQRELEEASTLGKKKALPK